jgi:sepiapterin reductase
MDYQGTPKDSVDNDTPIEETRKSVWALRTLCLITGASRGLGQRMAVRFAERFSSNSTLILVARNNSGLEETRASIDRIRKDVRVLTWVVDLAELNESMIHDYFEGVKASTAIAPSDFEQAIIVHNAGSMGNISELFTGQSDAEQLNKYWSMNLTSAIVLNATFWSHWSCKNIKQQRIVINISSICAKQAVKSWSIYCAGQLTLVNLSTYCDVLDVELL